MSNDSQLSRRDFIKSGVTTAAGLAAGGSAALLNRPERVLGANDRVRVAVCGVHGRGMDHIANYAQIPNVQIAALCDIDDNVLRERIRMMEKRGIPKPPTFVDVRKLLEDKSIDAISIATPNHWHSLMGIWACQAGKDVYVEKPCSHNLWEGKQFVAAAQRYNRIVKHGTQIRSATAVREGIKKLQEGLIGDVYMPAGYATNGATPSAALPSRRFREESITIFGLALRPRMISRVIVSTTTGTGFGIMEMATWATRARIRWTWRNGG